jgi:predicted acyl esterase
LNVDRKVFVPMRDGVRIALTTYLPDQRGPFPVVVESVPYRKDDDCFARDWQTYSYLADHGIAGVRIDIRGTGASEGIIIDEYSAAEMADTVEILQWAAEQRWSNGNVGMWGISWGGFSSLQTAMLQPEPLRAIMPMHATHDRFASDIHFCGGSAMSAEQGDWPASMIGLNALPPDPEIVGERWRELWRDRLERTPQWIFNWFRHQRRDEYWLHGSPCADYASIKVPTLLIGGWLDGYVDGMLAMLEKLTCPRRAVIGPWGHYRPATGLPAPTLDHLHLMAQWFGHHLRGDDNGIMDLPFLTSWIRTSPPYDEKISTGYWRADRHQLPNGEVWRMRLGSGPPQVWSGPQWIGSHAPTWDRAGMGSSDPSADDAASLVFESEPFPEPVAFLGQPRLRLMVASDQPCGLVAARLSAVDPSGEAHLICRGSKNLRFPDDLSKPEEVVPNQLRSVDISLLAAAVAIPAGWRLRVAVAGADFPIVWPPGRRFSLTIAPRYSDLVWPRLVGKEEILEVPEAQPPPAVVELEDSNDDLVVVRDSRRTVFRRRRTHRERQPDGLVYESRQVFSVSVDDDDPASTTSKAEGSVQLQRSEWDVLAGYSLEITGNESTFEVVVGLKAFDRGNQFLARTWSESIERVWA